MATDRPNRGEESDADLGDDRVRDDDFERDFGEGDPPDPLGQAEPAVTEAHLAEMGPDGPLDEDFADDEAAEGDEPTASRRRRRSRAEREERRARQAAAGRAGNEVQLSKQVPNGEPKPEPEHEHRHSNEPAHPRKGLFGRAADFLRASYAELRRVQWPDRRQVGQGTAVTLGFVVVAGAYLGLLDAIWNPIIQAIL
jgi:preprotein translocase SecE subunit